MSGHAPTDPGTPGAPQAATQQPPHLVFNMPQGLQGAAQAALVPPQAQAQAQAPLVPPQAQAQAQAPLVPPQAQAQAQTPLVPPQAQAQAQAPLVPPQAQAQAALVHPQAQAQAQAALVHPQAQAQAQAALVHPQAQGQAQAALMHPQAQAQAVLMPPQHPYMYQYQPYGQGQLQQGNEHMAMTAAAQWQQVGPYQGRPWDWRQGDSTVQSKSGVIPWETVPDECGVCTEQIEDCKMFLPCNHLPFCASCVRKTTANHRGLVFCPTCNTSQTRLVSVSKIVPKLS